MSVFSLISAFAVITYLQIGLHALLLHRRSSRNRVFFLLVLSFCWYSLCQTFYFSAHTRDEALLWHQLGAWGWVFSPFISLHFFAEISGFKKLASLPGLLLVYLPSLVFVPKLVSGGFFQRDIVFSAGTWHVVPDTGSIFFFLFLSLEILYNAAGIYMLYRWLKAAPLPREKRQARIILISFFVAVPVILAWDILMPALGWRNVPELGHLFGLVFVAGISWAIRKTRFMASIPQTFPGDILMGLSDMILVLDSGGRVLNANRSFEEMTGIRLDELAGIELSARIAEKEELRETLEALKNEPESKRELPLRLTIRSGEEWPHKAEISVLQNSEDDVVGFMLVLFDMRDHRELRFDRLTGEYDISAREREIVKLLVDGCGNQDIAQRLFISPLTVKTHVHRIYRKMKVKNKVELARVFELMRE